MVRWQKLHSFGGCLALGLRVRQPANVCNAGSHRNSFFCAVGCFNFFIAMACVSACQADLPRSRVKVMILSACQNVWSSQLFMFLVVCLMLLGSSIRLPLTVCGFAKKRISEHKTVNIPQKLMRGRMFN